MPTVTRVASPNKRRAARRELRTVLRAVRILGDRRPSDRPPPNLSPIIGAGQAIATAWRLQAALELAAAATEHLGLQVPEFRPVIYTDAPGYRDELATRVTERLVRRYRAADADGLLELISGLRPAALRASTGLRDWSEVGPFIRAGADRYDRVRAALDAVGARGMSGEPLVPMGTHDGEVGYTICVEDAKTGEIVCPKVDGTTFWTVVLAFVGAAIISWLAEDVFNATDDDEAVAEIKGSSCTTIRGKSDSYWQSSFEKMMAGPTGDEDEGAMLKVLDCLPCDRVKTLVEMLGGAHALMDEFNGHEWDLLMLRLKDCGLVDFSDWDDDATRLFINQMPQAYLALLSMSDIVTLCKNLFAGSTGDEDEKAICRLVGAQSWCKVKQLLKQISMEEFDDHVDGDEWETLSGTLLLAPLYCP